MTVGVSYSVLPCKMLSADTILHSVVADYDSLGRIVSRYEESNGTLGK